VLFHAYPKYDVYLLVYRCRLRPGSPAPHPVEVKAVAWVPRAELGAVNILPADAALVEELVRG
jgi:hypothetical protein